MGFFDDDPFENIIEKFFGGNGSFTEYSGSDGKRKVYKKSNGSSSNFIGTKKSVYFVLDLSNKKDVRVRVKDGLVTNGYGEEVHTGQKILEVKSDGEIFEYALPKKVKAKKMEWKFNNGILEVKFGK